MAVLTTEQILHKLKNPDSRLKAAKAENEKYLMHVHGIGVAGYITKLEGLENDVKIALRKRLSRSNKDLFSDILRPTDKVFHAKGGSKNYELSESQKKDFQSKLTKVADGMSLAKWLQNIWLDKYIIDPNGVILVENQEIDNERYAYPTYKSIQSICDYSSDGIELEYIIFEPIKDDKGNEYVRVYDDLFDALYLYKNETLSLIEDKTYPNIWGYVPGITCSDLINPVTFIKKSPIYEQVELADEYLRENSVKTLFKYHHGFPFFWQYLAACPVCKGTGQHTNGECKSCHGSGYAMKKDVSDVTYLKPPADNEQPTIAPNIAGYVTPPIDSWVQMTNELSMLRDLIYHSHWGTVINRDETDKTAFEVAVNTQPMQDRLNQYSDSAEIVEQKLTDIIGKYYFNESYKGSSINYGRNYIIASPNQLFNEYLDDKAKGVGLSVLNDKLKKYIQSIYQNDNYKYVIYSKLIQVEPFVHNTIKEVKDIGVPQLEFMKKIYYNEWLSTKTEDFLFDTDIEKLKSELEIFTKSKENETTQVQGMEGVV